MITSERGLLLCLSCEEGLIAAPPAGAREVRCGRCGARFAVEDGVIDLQPGSGEQRSLGQIAMETDLIVRAYESRLWRRNPLFGLATQIGFEHEQEIIYEAVRPAGAGLLLDLACGSGIYSRPLAARAPNATVVGLDLSMPMLRYASRRARQEGLRNLVLVHGTAMKLPLVAQSVGAVICCGALHLFPDAARVLRDVHRAVQPGGSVAVAVFSKGRSRLGAAAASFRRRAYGVESFTADELSELFQRAGFAGFRCHHDRGVWLIASAQR